MLKIIVQICKTSLALYDLLPYNGITERQGYLMKKIINLLCIILVLLSLSIVLYGRKDQPYTVPTVTVEVTVEVTAPLPSSAVEVEKTPEPTPENQPEYFTLSFIGDCTLKSHNGGTDFDKKLNGDFSYPFKNVVDILSQDDMTVGNLECTISDQKLFKQGDRTFSFLCPSSYLEILKSGSVEFVNTANNHIDDFGNSGVEDTYKNLEAAGISFCKKNEITTYETESGLKVGVYCETYNNIGKSIDQINASVKEGVEKLKTMDVDIIMVVFHFGDEGKYTVYDREIKPAHTAIDAGATIVYSSHPHVLQPVEEYNGGVIMYSMGNFTFGGNTHPTDPDTAIVQVSIKRDVDGTVSYEGYNAIPCRVSSTPPQNPNKPSSMDYNDYCPTPYEKDSEEWKRTIAKLDGTSEVSDFTPDYSWTKPAE